MKLTYDELFSNFAVSVNLRRYAKAFREMNNMEFSSQTGATISLSVIGWYRVPIRNSPDSVRQCKLTPVPSLWDSIF
jgi:hypothetical protein